MKLVPRADYRIVNAPSYVIFDCPFCSIENISNYIDISDKTDDDYNIFSGNAGIKVECEYCGKEFELANADIY